MAQSSPSACIEVKDGTHVAKTVLMPGDPLRAKFVAEHYLENPVLVKVCFATTHPDPMELSIIVMESNPSITYTGKVTECDKNGNIFYSFCTKDGEANNFTIFFRDADGNRSKMFSIFAKSE